MSKFWSLHTHSRFSAHDALPQVSDMVDRAVQLGYPALGLTDHGTPAGVVQLYQACRKAGIEPAPGMELYITPDHGFKEAKSNHLTVVAYSEMGYRNLVRLSTLANRNFFMRPRVDLADLASLAEDGGLQGLAAGTGCRSGIVHRTLMTSGVPACTRLVRSLAGWFPRTYVEVMNHGIDSDGITDDDIVAAMLGIADGLGLPVIVTADSHYVDCSERVLHDAMKELLVVRNDVDPSENRFSGEGYHLVDTDWLSRYLEPDAVARGVEGLTDLLGAMKVRIPELDTFSIKVPDVTMTGDPDSELQHRVLAEIEDRPMKVGSKTLTMVEVPGYIERLADELEVIKDTGMAGYLLLVAGLCDFMRERKIWYYVRGSVSGSLACLLLGISQDDPIAWGIRMDRFLSGDRASMPDIDLDIDATRRDEVAAELHRRFPTQQVCTYATYKLEEDEESGEQAGSLRVRYFMVQRSRREVGDKETVPAADWTVLKQLAARKLIKQTGTHAAGYLVAPRQADLDTLPLARIDSTGNLVTAYDKDDLEPFGFPKIDLLGSKTLQGIRLACEIVAPDSPFDFLSEIPLDDAKACALAGSGSTTGLFQLEGYVQRKGCQELKPARTADFVAAQALFRPAVSPEFRAAFLRRRRGEDPVPVMHPFISEELAESYGIAIYQEQIVGVLRRIGMPRLELTRMLKAVKASGENALEKARAAVAEAMPRVVELARTHDFDDDDIMWLESALAEYGAGYSFGKAHSVRYGMVAYITAWLRVREPLAFWCGMLTAYTGHKVTTGRGKKKREKDYELIYRNTARADGITLLPPHVNHSGVGYRIEGEAIRTGLVSSLYVGIPAAQDIVAKAPYESLRDLGEKVNSTVVKGAKALATGTLPSSIGDKTTVYALWRDGCLKGLPAGEVPAAKQTSRQQALAI